MLNETKGQLQIIPTYMSITLDIFQCHICTIRVAVHPMALFSSLGNWLLLELNQDPWQYQDCTLTSKELQKLLNVFFWQQLGLNFRPFQQQALMLSITLLGSMHN